MEIYLYPGYVTILSARSRSRDLFKFFNERGVELEARHWYGTIDSLPQAPSIIRASSRMSCSPQELARKCAELGHFCFLDGAVLLTDGTYSQERIFEEARAFLEKQNERIMDPALVIPYLRSRSKDRSTAAESDHAVRQARMLLKLFKQYVLLEGVTPADAFALDYRVMNTKAKETDFGIDIEGLEALDLELAEDAAQAGPLLLDDPRKQAYFRKLVRGMQSNLIVLEASQQFTEVSYSILDALPKPDFSILMGAFMGRHAQWGGTAFIDRLVAAMLPYLVERLVAAGYPDSDEIIEWEYEDARPRKHEVIEQ